MWGSQTLLLVGGLILAAWSVYLFLSALLAKNNTSEALAWASGDEPIQSKNSFINFSRPLVHNFTLQHALRVKSARYRKSVERKIATAGLSKELNVNEFIGLQILWGLAFPVVLTVLKFTLGLGFPYALCAGIGLIGAFFPHMYCSSAKKNRYTSVVVDLPFFLDLMALSTEAGLDFINAIERIVDKAEHSVLAEELGIVLKDIKLGSSRSTALRGLAHRLDIPEVTSFCSVVIDADETGASIARVLKEQSIQMRMERFVRAEKAGAKASQAMLIPMMVFIIPAVFIMVFAPVIIQFFYGGNT